jgi:hypothetical protein
MSLDIIINSYIGCDAASSTAIPQEMWLTNLNNPQAQGVIRVEHQKIFTTQNAGLEYL